MLARLVHMRSVAGVAGAICLALACSSEDSGDGAGGAAGSSPDVQCVSESQGCTQFYPVLLTPYITRHI